MTNYIDAKLLWNPTLDANDLQRQWLMSAYGRKAGAIMELYYQKLDACFKEFYENNDSYRYHAREIIFENLYAPHYAELEKLFLQAKAQPMTDIQKQRLQLLEDNMIVLQWRLRNAGYLSDEFKSPLQRDGTQVADLMFDKSENRQTKDKAFDLFPVLWYKYQPAQTQVKVALNETPPQQAEKKSLNAGYILMYAKEAGTVNLKAGNVDSGSAFVGYRIYEPKDSSSFRLLQQGLFYSEAAISFEAKANSLYMVSIMPQGFVSPKLEYDLSIQNAVIANGSFGNSTLYLTGKEAPLYVFVPKGLNFRKEEAASGVTLRTQTPQDAARAAALQQRTGTKVLVTLDTKWRFATDPDKKGLEDGFHNADFNDESWKTLTTVNTWQNQGFSNYYGVAWYRKMVNIPELPNVKKYFYSSAQLMVTRWFT